MRLYLQSTSRHVEHTVAGITMKVVVVVRSSYLGLIPVRLARDRDGDNGSLFYKPF
jgi:hypothetical protein